MNIFKREPVASAGVITTLVEVVVGLGLVFGWFVWTAEQMGAVALVLATVGSTVAFFIRSRVTPI